MENSKILVTEATGAIGGNAVPIFAQWIEPLKDLGVSTISLSDTGGTDHEAFDAIGIPGFQFIQDPLDYGSRTHHSNMDQRFRQRTDQALPSVPWAPHSQRRHSIVRRLIYRIGRSFGISVQWLPLLDLSQSL